VPQLYLCCRIQRYGMLLGAFCIRKAER
jgi:hypothetical protein